MNYRTLRPLIKRAADRRLARRHGPESRVSVRTYTNTQMALLEAVSEDRKRKRQERMAARSAAE